MGDDKKSSSSKGIRLVRSCNKFVAFNMGFTRVEAKIAFSRRSPDIVQRQVALLFVALFFIGECEVIYFIS